MTNIVILLDRSGSMNPVRNDMIGGVNNFISEQRKISDDSTFTLITFSTDLTVVHNKIPLHTVELLTEKDYVPCGGTALYDAIDYTVKLFNNESDVVLVIVTDGEENSSIHVKSFDQVKTLLESKTAWQIIYLNKGEEAMNQGTKLGYMDTRCMTQTQVAYGMQCGQNTQGVNAIAIGSALGRETADAVRIYRQTGLTPVIIVNNSASTI